MQECLKTKPKYFIYIRLENLWTPGQQLYMSNTCVNIFLYLKTKLPSMIYLIIRRVSDDSEELCHISTKNFDFKCVYVIILIITIRNQHWCCKFKEPEISHNSRLHVDRLIMIITELEAFYSQRIVNPPLVDAQWPLETIEGC